MHADAFSFLRSYSVLVQPSYLDVSGIRRIQDSGVVFPRTDHVRGKSYLTVTTVYPLKLVATFILNLEGK